MLAPIGVVGRPLIEAHAIVEDGSFWANQVNGFQTVQADEAAVHLKMWTLSWTWYAVAHDGRVL